MYYPVAKLTCSVLDSRLTIFYIVPCLKFFLSHTTVSSGVETDSAVKKQELLLQRLKLTSNLAPRELMPSSGLQEHLHAQVHIQINRWERGLQN